MAHHNDPDGIMASRLMGASTRQATKQLQGDARTEATEELRQIATNTEKQRRGALHPPRQTFRGDVMAEVAGIFLGRALVDRDENRMIAALRLIEAGAPVEKVEEWIPEGKRRAESGGAPFSRSKPAGPPMARAARESELRSDHPPESGTA
ncbi:hypothetical protein [Actinomadura rudentiformis]|uniref:Uncharacterized protein n=1 Tax=Actinomadura rudentiformis TaxID=359158 RepID=A0A6H9YSI5_9ACTN|nr:hypothetical protein [Actinomadura rudentiformis]KAB2344849.1 hypothetical protein F8566_30115 [Actinomadura rudentiformis]